MKPSPCRGTRVPASATAHAPSGRLPIPSGVTSRVLCNRVSQGQPEPRTALRLSRLAYQRSKATHAGAKPRARATASRARTWSFVVRPAVALS